MQPARWLGPLWPAPNSVDGLERLRVCAGALLGLLLTGLLSCALLGSGREALWLIAPMGASAVLLFAVPASPLAQPWSILGGNLAAAAIGVSAAKLLGPTIAAAGIAGALAIAAGFSLRCLHPPSGAVALTAVLGGPAIQEAGYGFVLVPVGLNSALLLLAAVLYNNLTGRRYPQLQRPERGAGHGTADPRPMARTSFTSADVDAVLQRYNQVLDVSRGELESLIAQTEMQAYRRRFGDLRCGDIMSRDLVTVQFATELEEAWQLLRRHQIKALPVLDRARRIVGIVTQADFLRSAELTQYRGIVQALRRFLRRTPSTHTDKPEVVGVIMTTQLRTAQPDTPIVQLVPLMSDSGLHHIPIVDAERRLVGMVTQSDLVAALYEQSLERDTPAQAASAA